MNRGLLIVLLLWPVSVPIAWAQSRAAVYPGAAWEKADTTRSGWSKEKLAEARRYFDGLAKGSAFVVEHGRVIAEWGDPARRVKLSSVRKSFLSALYGIHVRAGRLDLTKTLAQLGIDDRPPLTEAEKMATLRMVLQARSGVYHPYVGGLLADREAMPPRGSHPPGSFWYVQQLGLQRAGHGIRAAAARENRDGVSGSDCHTNPDARLPARGHALLRRDTRRQRPWSNRFILPITSA